MSKMTSMFTVSIPEKDRELMTWLNNMAEKYHTSVSHVVRMCISSEKRRTEAQQSELVDQQTILP